MKNYNKIAANVLAAIVLAGCGAESTINVVEEPAPPLVGQFVDAPVAGLSYKISREASGVSEVITGVTDADGSFEYYRGDSITFHIGEIEFPATSGANYVTPLQVFKTDTVFNQSVTNTLRLLQTLDADGDPTNGIEITEAARTSATVTLADGETLEDFFNQSDDDFASELEAWLPSAGTVNTAVISKDAAIVNFVEYVDDEIGLTQPNAFDLSKFDGTVFNPTVVNQAAVTQTYVFSPANDDNNFGTFEFTDVDDATVSGDYEFVFGGRVLKLTVGEEVTYLISRSYNTVDEVYSLCQVDAASGEIATLVNDCAFDEDQKVNLLTFSQAQTEAELIGLEAKKDDVGVELIEEFATDTDTFFTSSYKFLSKKLADRPLYVETGGSPELDATSGVLKLAGSRFAIGNAAPLLDSGSQAETSALDTVGTGIYNISEGFTISFDIVAHGSGGSLSLYVDNNSTSQSKSLHGDASKFFGKSFAELTTWKEFTADESVGVGKFTYTYMPGDDVVNGANSDPATDRGALNTDITNSFFQFRTDSSGDITIDNLRIDTVADSIDASDLFIPPEAISFNDVVDFTAAQDADLFSPEYLNLGGAQTSGEDLPGEADNIAMFALTGGTVELEAGGIALTGGSFTMGDYLLAESTAEGDTGSTGVLNLSRPYQIVLVIDSVEAAEGTSDTFEIYVDNDTGSAANSVHGADSLIYQADVANLVAGEMIIDNNGAGIEVGTAKSFLQFVTSGSSKVVISSIQIEPYVPPVPIKVSLPYSVDFTDATDAATLFTSEFQAVDGEAGVTGEDAPMFYNTGGTVEVDSNSVVLDNSRFTIGNKTPESGGAKLETSADDTETTGVFDLSRPYTISFDVVDAVKTDTADTSTSFMIYVDNNTSSSSKSVHGGDSKFYSIDVESLTPGSRVTVDGFVATSTSFIQLRAESGAKVELNNLTIEYADPNVFFQETFENNGVDFFTAEYRGLPEDSATAMYFKTGGTPVVTENNTLLITADRFTIGHSVGEKDTTADTDTSTVGVFDFSKPYKIVFDVISAEEPDAADQDNSFMIYMDNNTSSSSKSIHGGDSKFYSVKIADLTPGTVEVEGFIGTSTSFLQFRAESGGNVEIDNLRFEYIPTNQVMSENFETDSATFFTADYAALASDATAPLYAATGGSSRLTITDGQLTIDNARFTIGQTAPEVETSGDDTSANGDLDLSKPYKITFDVISASEPDAADQDNSFMLYVDNNTSSSSKSMHGGDSKFYSVKIADLTAGTVEIEGLVATASSFIQLRAESGAVVVIDNFAIEYLDDSEVLDEQFETTADVFFTPEYAALPDDETAALYNATGGSSRLTITDGQLTVDNARFTIGETNPGVETSADDVITTGVLDLSMPYKITMDIISASEPDAADQDNSFMLYVDNNTSSSSKSIHGGDSKFYSVKVADLTAGTLEIEGFVATSTSFIQLRAESGAVVVIDNLRIEYLESPSGDSVSAETFSCTGKDALYFCDDFASGTLDNWDINATDGNANGPEGVFDVLNLDGNNVMRYTAGSLGGVLATLKDSALANVPASDYFVEAKIRPRQNGTTANKQLYLMARYQDDDNWYGGGLNLQNSVASTQVEVATNLAGVLSRPVQSKKPLVLGERDATDDGTWYQVRFEVSGNDLSVYLNGELIGTQTDTTITAKGLVGIFTYNRSFELDDLIIGDVADKPLQLTIDSDETSWFAAAGSAALVLDVTALMGDGNTAEFAAVSSDDSVATVFAGDDYISINPVAEGNVTITLISLDDRSITRSIELEVGPSFVESSTDYGDIAAKLMPAPSSIGQYVDTSLSIEFDSAPTLGTVGKIRIYEADTDLLVDEINVADDTDTLGLASVGTRTLKYKPARIDGNTLIIKPHTGALEYNTEYYVVVGNDVALGAQLNGVDFDGLGQAIAWSFTTRSTEPTGSDITVDDDGFADFRTLQAALNYAMANSATPTTITLKEGEYHELLFLRNTDNLTIQGESRENTIVQYENYEGYNGGSSGRPVFLVEGGDMLVLNNFTIKNLHKRAGSGDQAETIYFNSSNRLVANNMNFISEQDTLLLKGYTWIYNSLVAGNVDFIWGYPVAALFENSEIRTIGDSKDAPSDSGGDYILQARVTDPSHPGFVFLNNEFTSGAGPMGNNVLDNSIYFARSSGSADVYDNIVLINNKIGSHIATEGWYTSPMPNPSSATATSGWREYGSMDSEGNSLDISGREADVALELSAPEASIYSDRASVFASWNSDEGWNPSPLDAPVIDDVVAATGDGGFAGYGFPLTGGAGGTVVTVANGVDLQNALASAKSASTPVVIYVDGVITNANSGNINGNIDIKDMDNVSIIGVADRGEFSGIGISIRRANNIIIQNLKIHDVPASFGDAIGMEGDDDGSTTSNIWIDHNELHGDLSVGKDDYDGLVDTKSGVENVTISYNYIHDHYKTMLNGSSDDDSQGERNITYHHNYFKDLESRVPLFRYGYGHLYNNVFENINSTAINSRMGAELLIEGNVFINVQNPIVSFYSREIGYWNVRDNDFVSVTWTTPSSEDARYDESVGSTSSYEVPYDYDEHLMDVSSVANYVTANVGVGVIDQSEEDIPDVSADDSGSDDSGDMVYATVPYSEDFEVANDSIFFSSAYKDLSGASGSGTPMYHRVTGTVSIDNGQLTMTGSRISIGNTTPSVNTTSADAENTGIFDLSTDYTVSFTVVSVADDTSRKFQIYVDNNTASSGNSINGSSSKFYEVVLSELTAGQTYTVDGLVASENSFITIRTEGGSTITLEDISID